ncbi:MAG: ANTAR domain-containing protein [Clostridia bacterium]|nr:ANTAR domain-containing protein [Clostridia bacterium]
MANLVVAFPDKHMNLNVSAMLESGGFAVTRTCMTGNEVMRAFNQIQDGLLVCAVLFPDRTAEALADDLDGQAMMLVLGRPEQLELCEHPSIFKLKLPATRAELNASISMLMQLFEKRKPRRTPVQDTLVQAAKEIIMAACNVDEASAHRAMQRYSMRSGAKLVDVARVLLDGALSPEILMK